MRRAAPSRPMAASISPRAWAGSTPSKAACRIDGISSAPAYAWPAPRSSCSDLELLKGFIDKPRGIERTCVLPEGCHDLHADRQIAARHVARHVHAGHTHKGPKPVEARIAGRGQTGGRRTG